MRRKNLVLCDCCKKVIGGISPRAMKDTPKRLLKSLNKGFCDKCEKVKKKNH